VEQVDLKSLTRAQVVRWFVDDLDESPVRANKVFQHLWQDGVSSIDAMRGVARATRERLAALARVEQLETDVVLDSSDGTRKFLWRLHDGHRIESVLIPDDNRLTLCMSSQVGCAMRCSFCVTGDMGLKRHLSVREIADQALQVQRTLPAGKRITNLVFMGMGEPLHNLAALVPALEILLDDLGMGFSHRRVTVSTVGLVHKMAELAARVPVNIAISLNATTEEQRRAIMPITRRHSLAELVAAAASLPLPPGKRITFEYVMFAGFNDTPEDAARLFALLDGLPAKVNLIPYNENTHFRDLKSPAPSVVKAFQHHLVSRGMNCTVRTTRGLDISAACGQLGRARKGGVVATHHP
jgi:23S rRNA (adenine2503-C2)-methyltransferase